MDEGEGTYFESRRESLERAQRSSQQRQKSSQSECQGGGEEKPEKELVAGRVETQRIQSSKHMLDHGGRRRRGRKRESETTAFAHMDGRLRGANQRAGRSPRDVLASCFCTALDAGQAFWLLPAAFSSLVSRNHRDHSQSSASTIACPGPMAMPQLRPWPPQIMSANTPRLPRNPK